MLAHSVEDTHYEQLCCLQAGIARGAADPPTFGCVLTPSLSLFDDLERGPLAVTRGGAGEQGTNRLDGLTVPSNHPSDVSLPKL
jgi:hypothetical protein